MSENTASIHIVRQYGPVGGMERYVWELTHALANSDQQVMVICETMRAEPAQGIKVIELGAIKAKPRWLSMLRFSARVSAYCKTLDTSGWVIHSHERTAVHQVTTFHGPPILARKKRALDFLSPRLHTWEYLEKRELCSSKVHTVLPNSILVSEQLATYYPEAKSNIAAPAYPGVDETFTQINKYTNGHHIGFIGKEWQRKGLKFACEIFQKYRQSEPDAKFIIAGPDSKNIQHLFAGWPDDSYILLGWCKTETFLAQVDTLLHPAKSEPFGMVIAEANAARTPVLISDLCGIASMITDKQGKVLSLEQPAEEWGKALHELKTIIPERLELHWADLARYHQQIYTQIQDGPMHVSIT